MIVSPAAPVDMLCPSWGLHSGRVCFPVADGLEVTTPSLNETTLLTNAEKAFALEPVSITRRPDSFLAVNLKLL